jgi:hypothetical protein
MRMIIAIIGVGSLLLSACGGGLYVKTQAANENQFIARHATGWFDQAQQQATENCAKYNKKALMAGTDCNLINPIYGGKECMTICQ